MTHCMHSLQHQSGLYSMQHSILYLQDAIIASVSELNLVSQVFVTRTIYSNVYLHIPHTFYIIDDNNLYSLYLHIPYVLLIIIIIHLLKKHACGSQRSNERDMTSRRRPTYRQLEVTAT